MVGIQHARTSLSRTYRSRTMLHVPMTRRRVTAAVAVVLLLSDTDVTSALPDYRGADLRGAFLIDADLTAADLSGATLGGTPTWTACGGAT